MASVDGRRRASTTKPMIRILQPNPKFVSVSILLKAMGQITPPKDDPAMPSPITAARFLLKYCGLAAMAGNMVMPLESPPRRP